MNCKWNMRTKTDVPISLHPKVAVFIPVRYGIRKVLFLKRLFARQIYEYASQYSYRICILKQKRKRNSFVD